MGGRSIIRPARACAAVALALLATACSVSSDLGGTHFQCDASHACPDGFACTHGTCEDPAATAHCSTPSTLVDRFDGPTISASTWQLLFGADSFAQAKGVLRITSPADDVTVLMASTSFFDLPEGARLTVHLKSLTTKVDSFVSLRALDGSAFGFTIHPGDLAAQSPTNSAQGLRQDARFLRFEVQDGRLAWLTSADGVTFAPLLFEPWAPQPAVLEIGEVSHAADGGDVLEVEGVNEELDQPGPYCPASTLFESFAGPELDFESQPMDCAAITAGELVTPSCCSSATLLHYALDHERVAVTLAELAPGATAEVSLTFLDQTYLTIEANATTTTFRAPSGVFGQVAARATRVSFRGDGGTVFAEYDAGAGFLPIGQTTVAPGQLQAAAVELGASCQAATVSYDDLGGSGT